MWLSLLIWLTGSRIGRTVAAVLATAVAVGLVALRAYGTGKASERLAQSLAGTLSRPTRSSGITARADDDAGDQEGTS